MGRYLKLLEEAAENRLRGKCAVSPITVRGKSSRLYYSTGLTALMAQPRNRAS